MREQKHVSCLLYWYTSRVEVDRQHPRTSKAYVFIVFHFILLAPSLLIQHILALILLSFIFILFILGCGSVRHSACGSQGTAWGNQLSSTSTVWVLEMELKSSGMVVSSFTNWAVLLAFLEKAHWHQPQSSHLAASSSLSLLVLVAVLCFHHRRHVHQWSNFVPEMSHVLQCPDSGPLQIRILRGGETQCLDLTGSHDEPGWAHSPVGHWSTSPAHSRFWICAFKEELERHDLCLDLTKSGYMGKRKSLVIKYSGPGSELGNVLKDHLTQWGLSQDTRLTTHPLAFLLLWGCVYVCVLKMYWYEQIKVNLFSSSGSFIFPEWEFKIASIASKFVNRKRAQMATTLVTNVQPARTGWQGENSSVCITVSYTDSIP